jgi:hypothetical protein
MPQKAMAGLEELRIGPGHAINLSIQNRKAGDCFSKLLENESRH